MPKNFSVGNDMIQVYISPEQLRSLAHAQLEEIQISRVCPIKQIWEGYKGHVLNLSQDIQSFLNRLPARVADLPFIIVRRHGSYDTHRDFTVR